MAFKLVIELITEFLYQWIKSSWLASAILIKYVLTAFLGYEIIQQKDLEEVKEDFHNHSHYIVGLMVATGLILHLANLSPQPVIPIIGEVTALAFYGYLFWDY